MSINVVVIGARGYTGSELLPLLQAHPNCQISAVGSSSAAGELISQHIPGMSESGLAFSDIRPDNLESFAADAYVLALPNGRAAEFVKGIEAHQPRAVVIDLSADYRVDDKWVYGQPERFGRDVPGATRIANPGCYATGAQLALAPVAGHLAAIPVVFGVSGYSGAGKTPSRKNDAEVLRDNILPYALVNHLHEREVSRHLGHDVRFLPHVASFFRGISLSISVELDREYELDELREHYRDFYQGHPLVHVSESIPEVAQVRGSHDVLIGGFAISPEAPRHLSLVCVLDNLLKGAATQVIQNLNLAFGLPPLEGLESKRLIKEAGHHE
jgi:N-acetyl-gamma-glutamyl-phosphate reductase